MGSSCCGKNIVVNTNDIKIVKRSQMILKDKVLLVMNSIIQSGGPTGKMNSSQMVIVVQLYNEWFNTNISEHNLNDCRMAVMNMRALYHQIRRGEYDVIEDEPIIEDVKTEKLCSICGEKLHHLSKIDVCKKCKSNKKYNL